MKKILHDFCKDFVSAEKIISRAEPLQMPYAYPICAQMFVDRGIKPDAKKLKAADKVFGHKAGLFFDFSGTSALMLISHLSMAEDAEAQMERIQAAKNVLRSAFDQSEALPLAAVVLTQGTEEAQWEGVVADAKKLYDHIRKKNRILTSGGDLIYSILMAKSGKKTEALDQVKDCYERLKEVLPGTEPTTLARVLTLDGDGSSEEKCNRFMELYGKLNEKGLAFGKRYQLPMLGLATLLPMETDDIVEDIVEVDKYLARQDLYRGLLNWYSATVRLMHATMIVAGANALERRKNGEVEESGRNALLALDISLWSIFYVLFI